MSRKCRAVVFREYGKPVSVEEVTVASPKKNEVMVKIASCGICHTDLSITNGTIPIPPPLVLGHEAAGVVFEVGEDVKDLSVGDHVIVSWTSDCGRCKYCRTGKSELCAENANAFMSLRDGTFAFTDAQGAPIGSLLGIGVMAEYATMHRDNVVKIDPAISLEVASLVGCSVMTGVGAVINTAKVEVGSTVVVFGAGGVGISAIQGAVMSGALAIIAVDVSKAHLELAKSFGATHFINPSEETDPVEKIRELTNGGADYAFECIGLPLTISQAYQCVHNGGKAVIVGVAKMSETVSLPALMTSVSEKILTGSYYGSSRPTVDFPKLLALYQRGLLKLDEMITARYKITEVNQAFEDLAATKNARGIICF